MKELLRTFAVYILCPADIAEQYRVSKYPTLKLFRYGQPTKREYRGQRSVVSIASFVEDQLRDPLNFVTDLTDIDNFDVVPLMFRYNSDLLLFLLI